MRALATLICALAATGAAAELKVPPTPRSYMTDFAGVLDPAGAARAEARLARLENESGHQVIAVLFPTLDGESLEDFTVRAAEKWQVGRSGLDDGAVFFAFVSERRMRLEVGYGLEAEVPDVLAGRVLDNAVRPAFAKGDFAGGVIALADALDSVFEGQPLDKDEPAGSPLPRLVLIALLVLAMLLRSIIMGPGGRRYRGRHPGIFWGGGGFGGGGFGGGLGGGGFTPGGGGFGGGGASGSW